jgi:hypothetical protein
MMALCWATPLGAAPTLPEFAVYLWGVPGVDDLDDRAAALAAAGMTVVDWEPDQLEVLARHGLKAMIRKSSGEVPPGLGASPTVWGYHLADEPYPESEFPALAESIETLRRGAPGGIGFVNMLSTTGPFLREYMRVVRPDLLSFDYYQWWWGGDRYFEKLEQFREQARLAGIPLASCIEASANPGVERGDRSYLPDNARKLRQSLYTNLAYGVKVVEWFSSDLLFETGSARLTQSGRDVASLNRELKRLGPHLIGLRSLDVFHTPPLSLGTRAAPREHWVQLIGEPSRDGLVLGMFEDDGGGDYAMVVNRDYQMSQSVTVRLQSRWLGIAPWHKRKDYHYAIEKLNKQTAEWQLISSTSYVGFTFVLGAGDGELFRIRTRVVD